ncbi:MAG: hypothetical protein LC720_03695, partial [Actinobacteria bacterium]|nr:hypothetical protein [Actinomycetota bacterium]
LRANRARTARVLAGYSEGGYGAVNIGLHHLATFAGIQSWSGYYVEGRSGTFAGASAATLGDNSPLDYAASLGREVARHPVRVFLYTGNRDPQAPQMAPLVAELRAAGVEATSAVYPGAHDWGLWYGHATQMLVLAARDFTHPPKRSAAPRASAARHALLAGVAVAAAARHAAHVNALLHDRQLAGCRSQVAVVARSASAELARLSRHGLLVVHYHLVRECLIADVRRAPTLILCARLPDVIAIERRTALRRRIAISAGCRRAVTASGSSRG